MLIGGSLADASYSLSVIYSSTNYIAMDTGRRYGSGTRPCRTRVPHMCALLILLQYSQSFLLCNQPPRPNQCVCMVPFHLSFANHGKRPQGGPTIIWFRFLHIPGYIIHLSHAPQVISERIIRPWIRTSNGWQYCIIMIWNNNQANDSNREYIAIGRPWWREVVWPNNGALRAKGSS